MSLTYPGGLITKNPTAPTSTSAPGIWTMDQALQYIKAGTWPTPPVGEPYFNYVSLLSGTGSTDGAQNNTFLDTSGNGNNPTRNGNTTQGTFTPFSQSNGYWSNYFDGSGDRLSLSGNSAFDISSGNFTVEQWVYPTSASAQTTISMLFTATNNDYAGLTYFIRLNTNLTIFTEGASAAVGGGAPSFSITSTITVPLNAWSHIALTRNGSTFTLWINGVSAGTATSANTLYWSPPTLYVGSGNDSAPQYFNGYISNYRIVKGTAVYTSAFTPPTSALTAISGTGFLSCQSNRFVDNSSNAFAITANGNVAVLPLTPFGAPTTQYSASTNGGSGYFDGSGDQLNVANNAAFEVGSGEFTYEAWVYALRRTNTYGQGIISYGIAGNDGSSTNDLQINSSGYLQLAYATGQTAILTDTNLFPINEWVHCVVCRTGSTLSMFVNGTRKATTTTSSTVGNGGALTIGGQWYANEAARQLQGYISSARVIKGSGPYNAASSSITVPTAPLTAITNTSLLCNFTNSGIFDYAAKNDLETVGNAQVDTAVTKYGNSMYFDGTGDWLVSPSSSLYNFGTGDFTIEYWIYLNSTSGSPTPIDHGYTGSGISANGYVFQYSSGQLKFYSNSTSITSSVTDSTGTWYHYAVVRCSGTVIIYRNGLSVASGTFTNSMDYDVSLGVGSNVRAGSGFAVGDGAMNGYITNLRITKGFCRYPYNFTPPTAAFGTFYQAQTLTADPYFDYTTLLLPGNGTDGANNNAFLDSSGNNFHPTRNGNTTQGTFSPFSQTGWSNYFDGAGDLLQTSSNITLGTGNFTVEAWVYGTTASQKAEIWINGGQIGSFVVSTNFNAADAGVIFGATSPPGSGWSVALASSTTLAANQWNHIAWVRSSGVVTVYINGSASGTYSNSSNSLNLGRIGAFDSATYDLNGYISNLRVVTGTAVYTTGFTPPTSALTAISGTALLTCQSNRFVDNSSNAFAITVNGNTSVQAFSPFAPSAAYSAATVGGSGYFDGTGDYIATSTSQIIPTGSFTIEAWVYTTNANSTNKNIISQGTSGDSGRTALSIESSAWWFQIGGDYVNSGTPVLGQWNYVAMTFNGSTIQGYVNGVSQGSISHTGNAQNTTLSIGKDWNNAYWNGYIASVRISNTVRTVTSVPTAPFANDGNTTFLANFTNAGITDATAKNDLETVGNAQISTTQSKFGGSSMYFDGTGDYLVRPNSNLFYIGSGDFTVEGWLYPTTTGTTRGIVSQFNTNGTGPGWTIYLKTTNVLELYGGSGTVTVTGTAAIAANIWTHFAICRYGSTITIYVNGVAGGTATNSSFSDDLTSSAPFEIGARGNNGSIPYTGYIDDLRITKGIARYTQSFTPPTSAFLTL